jgi:hypothetical protein
LARPREQRHTSIRDLFVISTGLRTHSLDAWLSIKASDSYLWHAQFNGKSCALCKPYINKLAPTFFCLAAARFMLAARGWIGSPDLHPVHGIKFYGSAFNISTARAPFCLVICHSYQCVCLVERVTGCIKTLGKKEGGREHLGNHV